MKALITSCIFLTSILYIPFSFATTGETVNFTFDGSRGTPTSFRLEASQTHTEYRTETQQGTCYRQVLNGYQRSCYWVTQPRCFYNRMGQYICQNYRSQRCENRPVYRSEPYSCTQQVQVPYEVFDYNVIGSFNFKFGVAPRGSVPHELFTLSLDGSQDLLEVKGSKNLIIYGEKKSSTTGDGELRNLDVNWEISFENLWEKFLPVLKGIKDVEMDGESLSFVSGRVEANDPVDVSLYLEQKKWGRNPVLINRVLRGGEYRLEQLDNDTTRIHVDLEALVPAIKPKKKHNVKIGLTLRFERSKVLNARDLPDNATMKEFTYKPRD
jgi:hypothetical protein